MKLLIIVLFMIASTAGAQILTKRDIAPLALTFVSGMFDGTAEAIKFHYAKFDKYGLDTSNNWWNPAESWKNKYKDRDPEQGPAYFGSTTFLVWTTDAYHCFRMGRNVTMSAAIVVKIGDIGKKKWWYYPIQAVIYWLTYTIGFTFSYDWIFG